MIRSMTGYGRAEVLGSRVAVTVECKSLNHRHVDVALRLPRALGAQELDARKMVQAAVTRGRVDVSVSIGAPEGMTLTPLTANEVTAREYVDAARTIAQKLGLAGEPPIDWLLAQPGVITREAEPALEPAELWALVTDALGRALKEMAARREGEGRALAAELGGLLADLRAHVDRVEARAPLAAERRGQRLTERMRAMLAETPLDEARIATEAAVWAERTDVSEELSRLRAHLDEFGRLLGQGGPVGRTLDFLVQEMNREVNTVGSKADDIDISQAVIAAKSALEKLREQAANVE
jgi:uncharacterized protein (TIGR00255 family)